MNGKLPTGQLVKGPPAQLVKIATTPRVIKPAAQPAVRGPVWPTPIRGMSQGVRPGHTAWDIYANVGDPIRAVIGGVVERIVANDPSGYGHLVILRDERGFRHYYGHNSGFAVRAGDTVQAGQVIALAGSTGRSTGPHLHYEIRDPSGRQVDPGAFYSELMGASEWQVMTDRPAVAAVVPGKLPSYDAIRVPAVAGLEAPSMSELLRSSSTRALTSSPTVTAPAAKDPQGTPLLQTPLGDIRLAPIDWPNLAAIGAGGVLATIAVIALVAPWVREHKGEIAGAAASAAKLLV